ncbi:ABC transporter permease [Paraburkholderia tropica]|uniref:ABC transporter permease n=1 Tax=Paraburkholderia tropica TaxID=92647 RepID=UPI002AB6AFE4|nr:ABC transporter permease [Paraburkholderia tropica]
MNHLPAYLVRRISHGLLSLLVMSALVFAGVYEIGNPVDILVGPDVDATERQHIIAGLGLDKPVWLQYTLFLRNVLHGDFGRSFVYGDPVMTLVTDRLPATLELAILALGIAMIVGIPAGLWSGLRAEKADGKVIAGLSILGFSLPTFWVGLVVIMVFAVQLEWLPAGGRGAVGTWLGIHASLFTLNGLRHIVLPASTLALFDIAVLIRLVHAATQRVLDTDYIRFAYAKGLHEPRIVGVHVLKNVAIPVVTVCALQFGSTIAFSVVTESVFGWPGIGKLLIDSIRTLDRPVIVAFLCLTVCLFVVLNMIVDVLYTVLDPRVRLENSASQNR